MVFIKPLLTAAAIFSVALGAPSMRRGESKEADRYEESSYSGKSYESNSYESSYKPEYEYEEEDDKFTTPESSHKTTTAEHERFTEHETKTTVAHESKPTYGSGSSNWDSGYDDCVSKCLADYGSKDSWYKPSPTTEEPKDEENRGNGVTHTVIVAPTQGVLRYIPFAVNASIGDTIKFSWGANNHTVTKGNALLPCNKTADALFTSGLQVKDFVFTQVVNSTDPTYFFCNAPTHCQKGMFGIINPPSSAGLPTSAGSVISDLKASNPDLRAYAAVVDKNTEGNSFARNWGSNIDIGSLPNWAQPLAAENIIYTRSVLAANPDIVKDGSIDLGSVTTTPMLIPNDVSVELANAAAAPTTPAAPTGAVSGEAASSNPQPAAETPAAGNGASALGSPRVLVALTVVVATFLSL
jgi:plastocyanin